MLLERSRRQFLTQGLAGLSAAYVAAHWSAILSAAEHACDQARAEAPKQLEFFTPEEAVEVEAISARIIPTTDTPGAREAGVIFFIDRALATFATDDQKIYRDGLFDLHAKVHNLFATVKRFSAASPEQQDQILQLLDSQSSAGRRMRNRTEARPFFETIRAHTIMGFLIDPSSDKRGNRDGIGWSVIGRENEHTFQPPFGYYDKDYPGWQTNSSETDKIK